MDLGIRGKNALVTGGSRGLGRQIALSLAGEGVNVAICARGKETLDRTAKELQSQGVKAVGIVADMGDPNAMNALHREVTQKLGPVDILVNNAGGSLNRSDISGVPFEAYIDTFNVNLFGGFRLTQAVIPRMKQQRWGRIINVASIWGREQGGNVSYMSAKAAVIAATKHSAVSLAEDGITVNAIAPGSIAFPGGVWDDFQKNNPPEVVQDFIKNNLPMGRFGWPGPVGDLAAFLASQNADLITGACIVVDGGQSKSMI